MIHRPGVGDANTSFKTDADGGGNKKEATCRTGSHRAEDTNNSTSSSGKEEEEDFLNFADMQFGVSTDSKEGSGDEEKSTGETTTNNINSLMRRLY